MSQVSPFTLQRPDNSLGTFSSPADIAAVLGLRPRAVYKAIDEGELRAFKFRGRLRVHENDLHDYIERSQV